MTHLVYVAVPIDQARAVSISAGIVMADTLRHAGCVVYSPQSAFKVPSICDVDDRITKINWQALHRADGLLAWLPTGVASVGVPMEIERARSRVPVAMLTDMGETSWSLQSPGLHMFPLTMDGLDKAVKWLIDEMDKWDRQASNRPMMYVQDLIDREGRSKIISRAHDDDAGFDLTVVGTHSLPVNVAVSVPHRFAVELPPGMWGWIVGRSSAFVKGLLVNPAVIDSGYRGEIFTVVRNINNDPVVIQDGDRISQLVPMPAYAPNMQVEQVQALSPTLRNMSGLGSTGR